MAGNIREFDNPVPTLQPDDRGVTAFRQLATHQESAGHEIGNAIGGGIARAGDVAQSYYDKAVTLPAVAKSGRDAAELLSTMTGQYQDYLKQHPDDPEAAKTFRENVLRPALDKYSDGAVNPDDARARSAHASSLYDSFVTRGIADTSFMAGEAVSKAATDQAVAGSAAVQADPAANLDATISGWEITRQAQRALVTQDPQGLKKFDLDTRAQEKEWVHGAVLANISKGGAESTLADIKAGKYDKYSKYFVDGNGTNTYSTDIKTLESAAQAGINALKTQSNADRAQHDRDVTAQSQARLGDYYGAMVDPTTNTIKIPPGITTAILTDPNLKPADRSAAIGLVKRMSAAPVETTASGLVHSMIERIANPTGQDIEESNGITWVRDKPGGAGRPLTQAEVMDHVGVDMTKADADFVLKQMKPTPTTRPNNMLLSQALTQARSMLVGKDIVSGTVDPATEDRMTKWEAWALPQFSKRIDAGEDPGTVLFDPKSGLLAPDTMQRFGAKDASDVQRFINQVNGGKVPDAKTNPQYPMTGTPTGGVAPPTDKTKALNSIFLGK